MQQVNLAASNSFMLERNFMQTPVKDLTFVAFDTETTGRHPIISSLIEISALKFRANGELLGVRSSLINPGRPIPQEVVAVHGITDDMVKEEDKFDTVIPPFVKWMQSQPGGVSGESLPNIFLAHNAIFDLSFLQVALTRLKLALPANPVLDTLKLARHYIRDSKNHRLKTLVENLGNNSSATYHRAEADSRHVMSIFLNILNRAGNINSLTLQDLAEAGGIMFFSKPFEEIRDHRNSRDFKVRKIGDAISGGQDLFIHYRGLGVKLRQITPHSVLYSGKRYFLSAFCHAAGTERTFRVDRIASLEMVTRMQLESSS